MAVECDFVSCCWTHLEVLAHIEEMVSLSLVVGLLADPHTAFVLVGNLSCS